MTFAELWLPIIGAGICIAWAIGAWYGDDKYLAIWLIFFGAVCLLLLATLQWQHTIEKANVIKNPDTASDLTKSQLRAYVQLSGQRVDRPSGDRFVIHIKNTGQTPARNVRGYLNQRWDLEKSDLPPDYSYPDLGAPIAGAGAALVPGQEQDIYFPIEADKLNSAERGEISLFLYGYVEYFDIFKDRQTCEFCYKVLVSRGEQGEMMVWGPHNSCT